MTDSRPLALVTGASSGIGLELARQFADHMPAGFRPIVADNDSTDGSAQVAELHGARVVQARPRGFGAACHAGLAAADHEDGIVCFLDADGSFDPQQLPRVVGPLLERRAGLVLGRRRTTARA